MINKQLTVAISILKIFFGSGNYPLLIYLITFGDNASTCQLKGGCVAQCLMMSERFNEVSEAIMPIHISHFKCPGA